MKKKGDSTNGLRIIKNMILAELVCNCDQSGIIRLTKQQIKKRLEKRGIMLPERPQNLTTLNTILDQLSADGCLGKTYRISKFDPRVRLRCGRHFFLKIVNWPLTIEYLQQLPQFQEDPLAIARKHLPNRSKSAPKEA